MPAGADFDSGRFRGAGGGWFCVGIDGAVVDGKATLQIFCVPVPIIVSKTLRDESDDGRRSAKGFK